MRSEELFRLVNHLESRLPELRARLDYANKLWEVTMANRQLAFGAFSHGKWTPTVIHEHNERVEHLASSEISTIDPTLIDTGAFRLAPNKRSG